jgi:hypothetical protein
METLFTCDVCKYKITKKHLYEKHLLSKNHLTNMKKPKKRRETRGEALQAKQTEALQAKQSEALALPALLPHPVNPESISAAVTGTTSAAGTNVAANVVGTGTRAQNRPALKPPPSFPKPLNKALYEKATADFNKYVRDNNKENNETFEPLKDNETTTTTTITDESGNTIIEKTTYSTTNTVTDYDVHIDKADFIKMMATSINELKETGDKKTFVSNFFDYMFRHITEIRHSSVTNPPRNIMYDDNDDDA